MFTDKKVRPSTYTNISTPHAKQRRHFCVYCVFVVIIWSFYLSTTIALNAIKTNCVFRNSVTNIATYFEKHKKRATEILLAGVVVEKNRGVAIYSDFCRRRRWPPTRTE